MNQQFEEMWTRYLEGELDSAKASELNQLLERHGAGSSAAEPGVAR